MTPNLEAAIQPISPTARQQLLQILTEDELAENSSTELKVLSGQFWQGISLQQLRMTQTPITIHNLKDLAADFWPKEDSIKDFLAFLRQQRQEVI
jgi:hypothetical protein